jgi:hypothetical protein
VVLNYAAQPNPIDASGNSPYGASGPVVTTTKNGDLLLELWFTSNAAGASGGMTVPATAVATPINMTSYVGQVSGFGMSYRNQTTAGANSADSVSSTGSPSFIHSTLWAILLPTVAAVTLNDPANGLAIDLSGTPTFDWTYNRAGGTGTQAAYALRRKTSGAYTYWNAGSSSWSGTIVWNTSTTQGVTFPSGAWTNGNTYNWSVAVQDTLIGGPSVFASDLTVIAQTPPTVTVTAPTGTVQVSFPTTTWTETLAAGAGQIGYRNVLYTAAQYGIGGFTPGISPGAFDSGVLSGSALSFAVPTGTVLPNNTSYRSYVQIFQTGSQASAWAFSAFALAVDAPAPPVLAATAGVDGVTGAPIITIAIQGTDNLLTTDDASLEGSIGTWVASTNCSVSRSSTQALDGTWSLRLSSTAAGTMFPNNVHTTPAIAGITYTAMASFRAGTVGRSCGIYINWLKADGVTFISNSLGSLVTDTTSGWVQATTTAVAPPLAAFAYLAPEVLSTGGASELHYVDCIGLRPGTSATWYRGGLVGIPTVLLESSDDGGVTWTPTRNGYIPIPSGAQQVSVIDYEAIPSTTRTYQAIESAVVSGATLVAPTSNQVTATITTSKWWIVNPVQPALSCSLVITALKTTITEYAATHHGLGSMYETTVADVVSGQDGTASLSLESVAEFVSFLALIAAQQVVWLSNPLGFAFYARLAGGAGQPTIDLADPAVRSIDVPFVGASRP